MPPLLNIIPCSHQVQLRKWANWEPFYHRLANPMSSFLKLIPSFLLSVPCCPSACLNSVTLAYAHSDYFRKEIPSYHRLFHCKILRIMPSLAPSLICRDLDWRHQIYSSFYYAFTSVNSYNEDVLHIWSVCSLYLSSFRSCPFLNLKLQVKRIDLPNTKLEIHLISLNILELLGYQSWVQNHTSNIEKLASLQVL